MGLHRRREAIPEDKEKAMRKLIKAWTQGAANPSRKQMEGGLSLSAWRSKGIGENACAAANSVVLLLFCGYELPPRERHRPIGAWMEGASIEERTKKSTHPKLPMKATPLLGSSSLSEALPLPRASSISNARQRTTKTKERSFTSGLPITPRRDAQSPQQGTANPRKKSLMRIDAAASRECRRR